MQRIDIDQISRDVAAGRGESKYQPTVVRVPLWLIAAAVLAIVVMAAHA
jgi:hypothetical protein